MNKNKDKHKYKDKMKLKRRVISNFNMVIEFKMKILDVV